MTLILRLLLPIIALLLSAPFKASAFSTEESEPVPCAWYHWDPYQHKNAQGHLEGLDIALVSEILAFGGYKADYNKNDQQSWGGNQKAVLDGDKWLTAGAFETEQRRQAYHVSKAYRYEWNALYIRADQQQNLNVASVSELTERLKTQSLRLGVIQDYKYTSSELNAFIAESRGHYNTPILESFTEEQNFENLINGSVDFVIADRLVGARILWKNKLGSQIIEHPLKLPALPIHALIHKSTNPVIDSEMQALVDNFNLGVDQLTENGQLDKIIGQYLFPVLMNITVQRDWFYLIDIIGAIFFSITGLLIAKDNRFDIFGTLVMTALLATGGGLIRDLLVGRTPVVLRSPDYLYIVGVIALGGFLLLNLHTRSMHNHPRYARLMKNPRAWDKLREVIEAIALGAYTIIGVGVAVEMDLDPLWLWGPILGCITSCGGSILAAALRKKEDNKSFHGGLDPECSLIWGSLFSTFLIWQTDRLNPDEVLMGVIVTLVGVTLTLIAMSHFKVSSPRITSLE